MVATLIVAELAFRFMAPSSVPVDYRFPDKTLWGIEEFVSTMSGTPGVRVAVIGDSIVWGKFADSSQTLSAYMDADYAGEGRQVHAFNFGMIGAQSYDIYPLADALARRRAADLLVINFDYHFYKDAPAVDRYPGLRSLAAQAPGVGVVMPPPTWAAGLSASPTAGQPVAAWVSGASQIVARRGYILGATLGGDPSLALAHAVGVHLPLLRGQAPWSKRTEARLNLGSIRTAYAVPLLAEDDMCVRYLVEAVRAARAERVRVVVFAGPLDRGPIEAAGAWDAAVYKANIELVRSLVEREGGTFLDLTDAVPAARIYDVHHPLAEGYASLARALEERIEPTVRELERERPARTGAP